MQGLEKTNMKIPCKKGRNETIIGPLPIQESRHAHWSILGLRKMFHLSLPSQCHS